MRRNQNSHPLLGELTISVLLRGSNVEIYPPLATGSPGIVGVFKSNSPSAFIGNCDILRICVEYTRICADSMNLALKKSDIIFGITRDYSIFGHPPFSIISSGVITRALQTFLNRRHQVDFIGPFSCPWRAPKVPLTYERKILSFYRLYGGQSKALGWANRKFRKIH